MARYHKRALGNHTLAPETQMMGFGYDPHLSEGALKPPVFLTSTFVFPSAQAGKDFFDYTAGRREPPPGQEGGLVYSRFNNPNLELLEDRLAIWDGADSAAVFSSGMAAISTTLLAFLRPGDVLLICQPLYGGTETLIEKVLPNYGFTPVAWQDGCSRTQARAAARRALKQVGSGRRGRIGAIMVETPGNPTNALVDLAMVRDLADWIGEAQGHRPPVVCDNTFLGPVFQNALEHGADVAVYSLTKYVGGHSDLVAGGATGSTAWMKPVRSLRGAIGTQLDANTSWMIMRSMETLGVRMERAASNARAVAHFLAGHPKVDGVWFLDFLPKGHPHRRVYRRQCRAAGSTFSFEVQGGEAGAFRLLDALQVVKLAVSLGGTETLASHPASTTHSGVARDLREKLGVTDALIRISVGIEHPDDLIADLEQALARV